MSEEKITENTEITETAETPAPKENAKPPRKPNYLLMVIACGYLSYLGIKTTLDLISGAEGMEPRWVFIASAIVFTLVGVGYGIHTLTAFIKEQKRERELELAIWREEQENEENEDEE